MFRRRLLTSLAAVLTAGIAGCSGDENGETSTPTPSDASPESSPDQTSSGAYVEYLVRNDDDEAHPLEVVIENSEGDVVQTRSDSEFSPGEQLGTASSGHDPEQSPFSITVSLESESQTIEWKADECPRFGLLVVLTQDGQLEVENEQCVKSQGETGGSE